MKRQLPHFHDLSTWAMYAGGWPILVWRGTVGAGAVLAGRRAALRVAVHPHSSRASPDPWAYGPIVDEGAEAAGNAPVKCGALPARLSLLPPHQRGWKNCGGKMGFTLEKIDVTLRPDLLAAKGIPLGPRGRGGRRLLFGLVTTKRAGQAIAEAREPIARR